MLGPGSGGRGTGDLYEVVVVRHGTHTTQRSDVYLNHHLYGEPDGPHTVDYYLWVVRNERRTVIVDTGFAQAPAAARGRTVLLAPAGVYRALGIDAGQPHQVVLTHAHSDHIGNLGLFPHSPVLISKAELDFWKSDLATKPLIATFTEPGELENLRTLEREGRLTTFGDSTEVAPGIDVIKVGGHTPGQSMVRVATKDGVVLLTSDAVHFQEELDRDMPFISVTDLPGMYAGFQRVRDMVADGEVDVVVPGHDASALDKVEPLGGPLAGNAGVIGRVAAVADSPVETLRRWEGSGAVWRVMGQHASRVTVGLFTCDGGEEVSRITSDDPALVAFLGGRRSSEDSA